MNDATDYLQSLGVSALGTRLRRLFESLNGAVTQVYRDELGFEQRWFALTLLLDDQVEMSVQSAADALGTSHVSVLQVAKAMEAAELLKRRKSKEDGRVVLLSLSPKGKRTAAKVHQISFQVDIAASALLQEAAPNFINQLTNLENALQTEPFSDRLEKAFTTKQTTKDVSSA